MKKNKKKDEPMKTYLAGERFPGRIGRSWEDSEPAFPVPPKAQKGAPNILYVIIDDIGFGWTECFGGKIQTPNIKRLADNGLKYTNFMTTALCSPTRACLSTGRNHHSVGMAAITEMATGYPGYNCRQPQDKAGVAAMLHQYGYTSYCIGKWHNTPSEETSITGPYDRWPTGPVFGFDRFYGFLGGDADQWYPKLHLDREPVDAPRTPEEGYHLSEDLVEKTMSWLSDHKSVDPEKPWLTWLAFGAMHAPHHVWPEWIEKYKGKFDMGWDKYREEVLAKQKELGILSEAAKLSPMLEGIQKWDSLSDDEKRLFTRMAEVYAGYMEHTDAQIGKVIDFLERTKQLDNTLIFVCIGDNGSSGEGTLNGLFNEQSIGNMAPDTLEQNLARIDKLGQPGSYNHYPVGWAMAGNTPFKLCKQYIHYGGTRNPLVVHWPDGIKARGEMRTQYHHVIDIVPTILEAIGVKAPKFINSVQQEPVEGYPMNYSFDDAKAETNHKTQYFEMMGNRGLYHDGWKIVTYHGRKPWENRAAWSFDEDKWELYNINEDPAESKDLMEGKNAADMSDPMVKKCFELVTMWWSEAGKYNVLPLDDRFMERATAREGLYAERQKMTFYEGAIRIQPFEAPQTLNRSWSMDADVEIKKTDEAEGPIVALGGTVSGWSLYLKGAVPIFCYNFSGTEYTYIRAEKAISPGRHHIRYEFERTGDEPFGAGGIGRIFVDDTKVAEGEIKRTCPIGYTLDETFDIGWDKGTPVSEDYGPNAKFAGKIHQVEFDVKPDFHPDANNPAIVGEMKLTNDLLRQ